jgi:hypothetical protein
MAREASLSVYGPTRFERRQVKVCLCTRCLLVSLLERRAHRIDGCPQDENERQLCQLGHMD